MGLLDDAIREHLELKRRRGADLSEIEREESEALGPVRRDAPADDEPAAGSYADHGDHDPAGLDEPGAAYDDYDDEPEPEPAAPAAPTAFQDHSLPDEPPVTRDDSYAEQTREFSATELDEALGADEAPPAQEPPADVVPGEDDADEDAEDELEETPDFLQETPEHDRLWFEQKPPKDFDF